MEFLNYNNLDNLLKFCRGEVNIYQDSRATIYHIPERKEFLVTTLFDDDEKKVKDWPIL